MREKKGTVNSILSWSQSPAFNTKINSAAAAVRRKKKKKIS